MLPLVIVEEEVLQKTKTKRRSITDIRDDGDHTLIIIDWQVASALEITIWGFDDVYIKRNANVIFPTIPRSVQGYYATKQRFSAHMKEMSDEKIKSVYQHILKRAEE
ncbi:MAG: hypothetical protein MMC23_003313 [Stictis urceolatum]|nr:hypothetical protein [Stictis urceolata]